MADPSKFISDDEMSVLEKHGVVQPVSTTESALRGAGQGLTLGFQPELSSLANNAAIAVHNQFSNSPMEYSSPEDFRKNNEAAKAANPKTFKASEIGGSIATMIPFGIEEAGAKGILSKITAKPVATQAALGAIQGAGENPENRTMGALTGGVLGGATAQALQFVDPAVISEAATSLARRALGFMKGDIKKLGIEKANATASDLLNRGVIHADFKDTAAAVESLRENAGKTIGDTLDSLDQSGHPAQIDKNKLIYDFTNKSIDANGMTLGDMMNLPIFKPIKNEYNNIVATMKDSKFSADTFSAAQQLKQVLKQAGWGIGGKTQGSDVAKQAYFAVRDGIDHAIENASAKLDNPKLVKQFMDAKKAYSSAKNAERAIDNKLSSITGNKLISLTDFVFAAPKMAVSGPGGITALLGKKFIEQKGAGFGANALQGISKALSKTGAQYVVPIARPALTTIENQKLQGK